METVKEAKPSADRLSWLSPMFGAQHDRFFLRRTEDVKTVESEMHMISLAVWIMYPVMFRLNSLTCSLIHCWQSTSNKYHYWISILLTKRRIFYTKVEPFICFAHIFICEQTLLEMEFNIQT